MPPIPLSIPCLRGNEWAYVKECLDTNWVSYVGPHVERFERELAAKAGARFAVAMSSGTAALHIALLLAGVGADDEVVMPALSFVAPANAVRYCGAWPAFTDVREDDWQWDVEKLREFFHKGCGMRDGRLVNKATGRRIAALLPIHLLGGMCDVDAVAEIASKHALPVVEDAAECLGAAYKGRAIGAPSPAYRGPMRLVITSFNGNKIVTTGGGGAVFADDERLAARARHLSTTAKADRIEFLHDEVGYNYRLTNIAAAMGLAQLEQLSGFVEIKRKTAEAYGRGLEGRPGIRRTHPEPAGCRSTFWMYTVQLDRPARPDIDRLNAAGVLCRPLWLPLPGLPAFEGKAFSAPVPVAESLHASCVSLPCSVGLTEEERARVIEDLVLRS
jgi:perosamine synthetase